MPADGSVEVGPVEVSGSQEGSDAVEGLRAAGERPGVCLVGCGWWGRVHALQLHELGPAVRRFYVSRDRERAREFARRFRGEAPFPTFEQAVASDRVDAVILSLPHDLHADFARAALEAGKHVLVDKPIALSVEAGRELVRLAERWKLCLGVAEQYRVAAHVNRAKEIIRSGHLGDPKLVRATAVTRFLPPAGWKRTSEGMGGGVLLDVGIHYLSILRLWFGDPDGVWATRPRQTLEEFAGEDACVVVLDFPGGPTAVLVLSWAATAIARGGRLEVLGDVESLEVSLGAGALKRVRPLPEDHWANRIRRSVPWRIQSALRPFVARLPREDVEHWRAPDAARRAQRALIEDFVHSVILGRPPAVPGREGVADLRLLEAAYRSLETGRREVLAGSESGPDSL